MLEDIILGWVLIEMLTDNRGTEKLIIPYGIPLVSKENIDRLPYVELIKTKNKPLRLGHGPYDRNTIFEESSLLLKDKQLSKGESSLEILRRIHLRDCGFFEKNLRTWVNNYFDFIIKQINLFSKEIQPLSSISEYNLELNLWGMAAMRPLPRAHIPGANQKFLPVDIAFWDGNEIIALLLKGGDRAKTLKDVSSEVRVFLVESPSAYLSTNLFPEKIEDKFTKFWLDIASPPDPFGPALFRNDSTAVPLF
jgi:hypothetical protein